MGLLAWVWGWVLMIVVYCGLIGLAIFVGVGAITSRVVGLELLSGCGMVAGIWIGCFRVVLGVLVARHPVGLGLVVDAAL